MIPYDTTSIKTIFIGSFKEMDFESKHSLPHEMPHPVSAPVIDAMRGQGESRYISIDAVVTSLFGTLSQQEFFLTRTATTP